MLSKPGRTAVAARIECPFEHPVNMPDNGPGVTHGFAVVRQQLDLVSQRPERGNGVSGKTAFQLERIGSLAPGTSKQPAGALTACCNPMPCTTWRVNIAAWVWG